MSFNAFPTQSVGFMNPGPKEVLVSQHATAHFKKSSSAVNGAGGSSAMLPRHAGQQKQLCQGKKSQKGQDSVVGISIIP